MSPGRTEIKWSGRKDLNLRPPGPEPGALARLRYAPTVCARAAQISHANQARIAQLPRSRAFPAIVTDAMSTGSLLQLHHFFKRSVAYSTTSKPRRIISRSYLIP